MPAYPAPGTCLPYRDCSISRFSAAAQNQVIPTPDKAGPPRLRAELLQAAGKVPVKPQHLHYRLKPGSPDNGPRPGQYPLSFCIRTLLPSAVLQKGNVPASIKKGKAERNLPCLLRPTQVPPGDFHQTCTSHHTLSRSGN